MPVKKLNYPSLTNKALLVEYDRIYAELMLRLDQSLNSQKVYHRMNLQSRLLVQKQFELALKNKKAKESDIKW